MTASPPRSSFSSLPAAAAGVISDDDEPEAEAEEEDPPADDDDDSARNCLGARSLPTDGATVSSVPGKTSIKDGGGGGSAT